MVDCIILTATKSKGPAVKTAGPHRIATELRQSGFTCQIIDITFIMDLDHLLLIVKRFVDDRTLWIGLSNTFMERFCDQAWLGMGCQDTGLLSVLQEFTERIKQVNNKVRFIYGNAGLRQDITSAGFVKFEGFVDAQVLSFTQSCRNGEHITDDFYCREFEGFTNSKIIWTKHDIFNGERAVPIEISRGCIFRCDFCRFPLNGKRKLDYIKDLSVLESELMYNYEQFGIRDYIFTDDTFNDSIHKLRSIQKVRDRLPFDINFVTYIRLDLMMRYPEMVDLLRDLGLVSATLGIETAVPENAKLIGKNVDFYKQIEFLHKIKQSAWKDINTSSGFIIGLPYDTTATVDHLVDFLFSEDNPLDNFIVSSLQIYPADKYNMTYSSVIDRDYEKFGYRFDDGFWTNTNSGLAESNMLDLSKQIYQRKLDRVKYTGFEIMDLQNIGISKSDLLSMTMREIDTRYDVDLLLRENYKSYLSKLMRLDRP